MPGQTLLTEPPKRGTLFNKPLADKRLVGEVRGGGKGGIGGRIAQVGRGREVSQTGAAAQARAQLGQESAGHPLRAHLVGVLPPPHVQQPLPAPAGHSRIK